MNNSSVINSVINSNLIKKGSRITVALSGGADSVCLFHILYSIKDEYDLTLQAAHFNHLLRGEESDKDQNFCEDLCRKYGIELIVSSGDVSDYAKKNRLSTELAAREMRYSFFESINTDFIATAHNADDNCETVLLNLTRGTGLKGLCGIPLKRDRYIRPLISVSREQIESYCEQNCLQYVTDSTNLTDDYSRNKIRHSVIPILKNINPSFAKTIMFETSNFAEDYKFIEKQTDLVYNNIVFDNKIKTKEFNSLDIAIKKRILFRFFADDIDAIHIPLILKIAENGGKCSIKNNKYAFCIENLLFFKTECVKTDTEFEVNLEKTKNTFGNSFKNVHNSFKKNMFDCDRIKGKYVLRSRCEGDKIRLKNKNCTKTIKKLCTEYKIPASFRKNLPVISDEIGPVWIYGIGVADRCAVNENSKNIIKIETIIKG